MVLMQGSVVVVAVEKEEAVELVGTEGWRLLPPFFGEPRWKFLG